MIQFEIKPERYEGKKDDPQIMLSLELFKQLENLTPNHRLIYGVFGGRKV